MQERGELLPANRQVKWIGSWLKPYLVALALTFVITSSGLAVVLTAILFTPLLLSDSNHNHTHGSNREPFWLSYTKADWLLVTESGASLFTFTCAFNWVHTDLWPHRSAIVR